MARRLGTGVESKDVKNMDIIKNAPISCMENAFSVKGLNVVVTGGNRGLGRGISQAFAECGANVAILCRNEESGAEAAKELETLGGKCFCVQCDVGDFDSVVAAKEAVAREFDHVDVLVNNAGIDAHKSLFDDERLEEWKRVMSVNLDGVAACVQQFGKWMMDARRGGSIINISSIGGQGIGDPRINPMPPYNASKAALDHLTRHLSIVMGDYGIRVNCIAPGPTHSGLDGDLPDKINDFIRDTMPAHRFGEPIEIGALAVYLASPAGSQVTGTVINHDGGTMVVGLTF